MKKLFITLLCVVMVAVFMPTMAFAATDVAKVGDTGYATLQEAVNAGGTVELLQNVEVSDLQLTKSVTVNMNGNKITGASNAGRVMLVQNDAVVATFNGGTIEVTNATPGSKGIQMQGGTLNLNGVTMTVVAPNGDANYNYGIYARPIAGSEDNDKSVVNINDSTIKEVSNGTDAKNYGVSAIAIWGSGEANSGVLNMSNTNITVGGFSVAGNGTGHGTNFTLTKCNLTSEKGTGIYHPQNGDMVIDGGSVTGTSGIEVRAGNVTVKGGAEIKGTATPESVEGNGSGTTTLGAGIAVAQHRTKLPINVVVEDADVSGTSAVLASNAEENDTSDLEKVDIEIKGGNFEGRVETHDGGNMSVAGGTFEKIGENVIVDADDVAKVTEDGVTKTVVGLDNINEAIKDAPAGTVVEVTKAAEGSNIVAPEGVKIENKAGATVKVNGDAVEDGKSITTTHEPVKTAAKAATCTEEGNIEYWYCASCGKYYKDQACTKEIAKKDTVVAKIAHTYKDGKCTVCGAKQPVPETNDINDIMPWAAVMLLAAAATGCAALKRREER